MILLCATGLEVRELAHGKILVPHPVDDLYSNTAALSPSDNASIVVRCSIVTALGHIIWTGTFQYSTSALTELL